MSWSYSKDPSTSSLDALRFLIGDTNEEQKQFENEELEWVLEQNGDNPANAAIAAVDRLIAKYSRLVDKAVGDLKISYSQQHDHYAAMKDAILDSVGGNAVSTPIPYAGGISRADRAAQDGDTDRVPPVFEQGQHDYDRSQLAGDVPPYDRYY